MKGFFLRIPEDLEDQFSTVCEREGYKKGGLILKWIRNFVEKQGTEDPVASAQAYGIDLGQLQSNLRKSPTERLRQHQDALRFVKKIQGKARKK